MSVEYTSLLKTHARSADKTCGGVGQSKIPQPQRPKAIPKGSEATARTVTLLDVTVRTDTAPRYSLLGYSNITQMGPIPYKPKGVNYEKTTKDVKRKITQIIFQNCQKNSLQKLEFADAYARRD